MTSTSLTFIDVGHGNAAVLQGSDGAVLIDAGPGPYVLEYLQQHGITALDAILISHADADHLKGLIALLGEEIDVGEVRLNSDALKGSKTWDSVLWELEEREAAGKLELRIDLHRGQTLPTVDATVSLEVLAPRSYLVGRGPGATDRDGRRITSNTMSAVLAVRAGSDTLAMLAGDIDEVGLAHLVDTVDDLSSRLLMYPHHGGNVRATTNEHANAAFAQDLATRVQPDVVLFSIGRGEHGTPRKETIAAIRDACPRVRIACTQLSEHCAAVAPPRGAATHLSSDFARGRARSHCCAGTLRIDFPDGTGASPNADEHHAFKQRWAPTALCLY
ncbi:MBL fold metallo-hydrolase [Pseudonocardia sp.]|jgi:competence protein ComEC|uniref:ComEC/Rec2 family competence protein n=1 Tax=Pseudonocardia sp. TaxID=60912 RepID=UPI0031FBBC12